MSGNRSIAKAMETDENQSQERRMTNYSHRPNSGSEQRMVQGQGPTTRVGKFNSVLTVEQIPSFLSTVPKAFDTQPNTNHMLQFFIHVLKVAPEKRDTYINATFERLMKQINHYIDKDNVEISARQVALPESGITLYDKEIKVMRNNADAARKGIMNNLEGAMLQFSQVFLFPMEKARMTNTQAKTMEKAYEYRAEIKDQRKQQKLAAKLRLPQVKARLKELEVLLSEAYKQRNRPAWDKYNKEKATLEVELTQLSK